MKFILNYTSVAVLLTLPFGVMNLHAAELSSSIGLGVLSTKTNERVYDPETGGKNSQLDWEAKDALIVNAGIDFEIFKYLSIGAKGWSTINSTDAHMDDYDWKNGPDQHWSDYLSVPNTNLKYANEFDLNATAWILNEQNYKLGAVIGYQENRFSWDAQGGNHNYDNGTDIGSFPHNEKIATYKQKMKTPYIGLQGSYKFNNFEIASTFKFSNWVKSTDVDHHIPNQFITTDKVKDQKFYSFAISGGYYVIPSTQLFVEAKYAKLKNKKGDVYDFNYSDTEDAGYDFVKNAAGIENKTSSISAGIKYTF